MPEIPQKFTGQAAMDAEQGKKLDTVEWEFEPPAWIEEAVDLKVSACGVCGSCVHTIRSGWGESQYPCVVGHEIVGTVVRAGKNQPHKVGDRVGFGAQSGSCMECETCRAGQPNVCMGSKKIPGMIGTYQGGWPTGEKEYTKGGYADYFRGFGAFAVPIPKELSDEIAAPMLCGGVTTYTPLVENGAGPGKKVGIIGIGGLGHFGLLWSKALGADTYALSHSHSKEEDVAKMGVPKDHFIVTADVDAVKKQYSNFFDLLVVTANHNPPLSDLYLPLLRPYGKVVFVGLTEGSLPAIKPQMLTGKSLSIGGSIIGSPQQIKDMLALAVKHNVRTWAQVRPMKEAGQALKDLDAGKARYRLVLVN